MKINMIYVFIALLLAVLYMMFMPKTSGYGGRGGYGVPCTSTFDCKGNCVRSWFTGKSRCTSL